MCCVGDIILVDKYKHNGKQINKHSFVVVDDDGGEIQGFVTYYRPLKMKTIKSISYHILVISQYHMMILKQIRIMTKMDMLKPNSYIILILIICILILSVV